MITNDAAQNAMSAQQGKVKTHAFITLPSTYHFTLRNPRDELAPAIEDVIVCVVESGMPKLDAVRITDEAVVVAISPSHDSIVPIFLPTVAMIR